MYLQSKHISRSEIALIVDPRVCALRSELTPDRTVKVANWNGLERIICGRGGVGRLYPYHRSGLAERIQNEGLWR